MSRSIFCFRFSSLICLAVFLRRNLQGDLQDSSKSNSVTMLLNSAGNGNEGSSLISELFMLRLSNLGVMKFN
uniref:Secreted protein n=1 Tax=Lotus japonicus TaxID=34305 RepID=I3SK01_LOTJA|nr:unknown [Lotus japonicus]